nr:PREDICTED: hypermethylated in cancer 1 protein [Equus przewalskii]
MLDTMEAPGHSRQLLLQLNNQRTKGFLCDVIIVVQNALFRAHKNVLAASSAYLKSLVVHDNLLNLDHDMVSPAVFRLVLDFIYTGRLADGAEAAAASVTTHFLHDPKVALESLYPLAKFTAELGLSPDKAAEVLSQGAHLAAGPDGRTIDRFSPT